MADEVNPRVALIDRDLQRWREKRAREEQRIALIDEQIRQLEEARAAELEGPLELEPEHAAELAAPTHSEG